MKSTKKAILALKDTLNKMSKKKIKNIIKKIDKLKIEENSPTILEYLNKINSIGKQIYKDVYGFKTKHPQGFIKTEIEMLLLNYPNINMDKFSNALQGITVTSVKDETVIYHCDIEKALLCGVQDRDLYSYEFD